MTNFANAMKNEVLRLARKEVRAELEGLKKASAQQRKEIVGLKRDLSELKKLVARLGGKTTKAATDDAADQEGSTKRFSAKGFATHRKKLGLSAEEAGLLLEVSAQTVYGWEKGRKPQERQLDAIAAFRKMGKREAKARLEASAK